VLVLINIFYVFSVVFMASAQKLNVTLYFPELGQLISLTEITKQVLPTFVYLVYSYICKISFSESCQSLFPFQYLLCSLHSVISEFCCSPLISSSHLWSQNSLLTVHQLKHISADYSPLSSVLIAHDLLL
jgi:hypothetical protein